MRSPQPSPSTLPIVVQRTRDLKSRMRELRTSGSVGAPGGRLPGATRPGRSQTRACRGSTTRDCRAAAGEVIRGLFQSPPESYENPPRRPVTSGWFGATKPVAK